MDTLFSDLGYADAFREVNGDNDEFTWWPGEDRDADGWRVDYQVVSASLRSKVEYGAIYKNQVFAQHAPLIMDYDYELFT
jgi:exodeoxyribonuclease III